MTEEEDSIEKKAPDELKGLFEKPRDEGKRMRRYSERYSSQTLMPT
jgi:hypothetical protein